MKVVTASAHTGAWLAMGICAGFATWVFFLWEMPEAGAYAAWQVTGAALVLLTIGAVARSTAPREATAATLGCATGLVAPWALDAAGDDPTTLVLRGAALLTAAATAAVLAPRVIGARTLG